MKYKCAYCGKEYDNIENRMTCEKQCNKKHLRDKELERKKKLKEEQRARYEEITELYKKVGKACDVYNKAIEQYDKDYKTDSLWDIFGII